MYTCVCVVLRRVFVNNCLFFSYNCIYTAIVLVFPPRKPATRHFRRLLLARQSGSQRKPKSLRRNVSECLQLSTSERTGRPGCLGPESPARPLLGGGMESGAARGSHPATWSCVFCSTGRPAASGTALSERGAGLPLTSPLTSVPFCFQRREQGACRKLCSWLVPARKWATAVWETRPGEPSLSMWGQGSGSSLLPIEVPGL